MIEIRLEEVADRLGKSISDIARETGLNRNTITDLFHNKVDGVKFSTIDTLCETYGLTLQDLVVRKEFRIGAAPTSEIIREIRSANPFLSWLTLNALHTPSPRFFDHGVGNVYTFFIRNEAELYVDRREANRCARNIYESYRRNDVQPVYEAFTRARDQVLAYIQGLTDQPINQYVGTDLFKAFQRLCDLSTDVFSVSTWIDAFDFGVRDELVQQVQKAHHFTSQELAQLLASGETTPSIKRRLSVLKIAHSLLEKQITPLSHETIAIELDSEREVKRFFLDYPYIARETLIEMVQAYIAHPDILEEETRVLSHLPQEHTRTIKALLYSHGLRLNPLAFFATLTRWRDERDELTQRIHTQMERILRVVAKRNNIRPEFAAYLLPQELDHAQNGLVTERTLQHRYEQGLLVALEQGNYKVHEGEQAISIQDDLASRYLSQLAYEDLS